MALKLLSSLYGFPYGNADLFSIPSSAYNLLWIENTLYDPLQIDIGTTWCVMSRPATGKVMLYGFALGDLVAVRYSQYGNTVTNIQSCDLSALPDIGDASLFAFSSLKDMMYYAVDGDVYQVNLASTVPAAVKAISLPGETISLLRFYPYYTDETNVSLEHRNYDLIVGTEEGRLRIYDGWSHEGDFTSPILKEEHDGFSKIIDVIYREQ